jgi:hypothetical protein
MEFGQCILRPSWRRELKYISLDILYRVYMTSSQTSGSVELNQLLGHLVRLI